MTDAGFGTHPSDLSELLNTHEVISEARIRIIRTDIDSRGTRSGSSTGRVRRAL